MTAPYDRLRSVLRGTDDDRRVGRYELERELGQGGMAVVYEARDPELGRKVAVKVLRDAAPDRLRQEASAAARLRHPNIVTVHEIGPGYIVMDLVDGRPLDEAAKDMTLPQRVAAVEAIARAVAHAHAHGVIHRDIKPRNVLVDASGRVVLTDFGLAKVVGSNELTLTGATAGTPHYMAPEQIRGRDVGPAADVWALGVVLYELVTGRRPFEADAVGEVYDRILHASVARPPSALGAIALRALERRPERRYRSAAALADDLAGWREGRSLLGARLRAIAPRRVAVGAVVILLGAALAWFAGRGTPDPDQAELYLGRARVRIERAVRTLPRDPAPEYELAAEDLRRALAAAPTSEEVHEQVAKLRWYQAAHAIDRGRAPGPACDADDASPPANVPAIRSARAGGLFMCGRWLRRVGRPTEGDRLLADAESLLAGDPGALALRGLIRAFRGRFDDAERDFAEADRRGLSNAKYHGEARALAGDHAGAERYLGDARSVEGLLVRGRARIAAGRFDEGAADLRRVLQRDPTFEHATSAALAHAARRTPVTYAILAEPPPHP